MESTITASSTEPQVTVGVDTHKQFHVAHAVDRPGRSLGSHRVSVNARGYRDLVSWAQQFGPICQVGIEGPGHYGAGLSRHLRAEGIHVIEVGRPKKQRRARYGKSDDADAAGAAAMVLAGEALGDPKNADGPAEMVRILRVARASAVRARGKAFLALKDLIVTAPDGLRAELTCVYRKTLLYACRTLVIPETTCTPSDATKIALKSLAVRCHDLDNETERLGQQIDALTAAVAPALRAAYGVGPDCAATLLAAAGDNPPSATHRCRLRQTLRSLTRGGIQRQSRAAPAQPGRES